MKIGALLTFITILVGPKAVFSNRADITIVEQKETSNFYTQRLWFNITNTNYLTENSNIVVKAKEGDWSKDIVTFFPQSCANWNGGIYYFVDLPLSYSAFQIVSIDNDSNLLIKATKWRFEIYSSRLYEVYGDKDIVRYRNADVYPPDAYIIALYLSGYCTYNSNFENGYSAYEEMEHYWLKQYGGGMKGSLENTFLYDYYEEDYISKDASTKKSKLISASDKISEIESMYRNNPIEKSVNDCKIKKVGFIFLLVSILISGVLTYLFLRKKKNDTQLGNI